MFDCTYNNSVGNQKCFTKIANLYEDNCGKTMKRKKFSTQH